VARLVADDVGLGVARRVRAAVGAFLGAGAERILDDLVDGAGATAAFGAAAKAAIELPRRARQTGRSADRAADVVVAQNIAGTDDQGALPCDAASSIVKAQAPGKAKRFNFKIFQTALVKSRPIWNKSKQLVASRALIQITADASVAEWCRAARWDLDAATASSVSAATISGTAIGIAAAVEVAAAVVAMIEVAAVPAVAAVNVAAA
jgi:hypothetical protein